MLALDGKWQGLEKIRVLMGAKQLTARVRHFSIPYVAGRRKPLIRGIEADKQDNPFLARGVSRSRRATQRSDRMPRVRQGQVHAKTYITHAKLEVVGSQALVGSSNFTKPGLTENIELNVQIQSAREVAQLQDWFEAHWNEAKEITDTVIETVERQTRLYSPFEVLRRRCRSSSVATN